MRKIPVFATIAKAYGFLGHEFLTIFRLSWFAFFIGSAMSYVVKSTKDHHHIDALKGVRQLNLFWYSATEIGVLIFQILMGGMIAAALSRLILVGDRQLGRILYFSFGKVELIFAILPIIAIGLGVFAVSPALGIADYIAGQDSFVTNLLPLLIGVSIISIPILLSLRICFIFPLAVREGTLKIAGAWHLARRNGWRLVLVIVLGWVACLAPITAALIALSPTGSSESGAPGALLYLEQELDNLVMTNVVDFLGSIVITAVGAGLICFAFKAVTDSSADTTEGNHVSDSR
jgi:hypothetical protein